jgi:very-short-patch-repair endonuclease
MDLLEKKNYLTLIEKLGGGYGLFNCDCGTKLKRIRINAVTSNSTKSCGCHVKKHAANLGKKSATHGKTGTKEHNIWSQLRFNKDVCEDWKTFENFYEWLVKQDYKGKTPFSETGFFSPETTIFIDKNTAKKINQERTCLEKYGTKSHLQSEEIKEKIRITNLEKYGYEYACKSQKVKDVTRKNNLEKYGVEFPQQLPERIEKQRERNTKEKHSGLSRKEWAEQMGIARTTFNARVRKHGFDTAISMLKYQSGIETLIENILINNCVKYEKQVPLGKYKADFVIEDKKVVIEANGCYWHSDAVNKDKKYHKNKLNCYNNLGYNLLAFREDEIEQKQEIVESIIKNKLGIVENRFFARNSLIRELTKSECKDFLNKNHLMGYGRGKCFALIIDQEIIAVMQYIVKGDMLDISRFCPKLNSSVVGGFTKLLSHIEKIVKPKVVQNFIDRQYGSGDYLLNLGFKKVNEDISFRWVKDDKVFHRLKFRGSNGYDYGYYKFWDCGQAKYIKVL